MCRAAKAEREMIRRFVSGRSHKRQLTFHGSCCFIESLEQTLSSSGIWRGYSVKHARAATLTAVQVFYTGLWWLQIRCASCALVLFLMLTFLKMKDWRPLHGGDLEFSIMFIMFVLTKL